MAKPKTVCPHCGEALSDKFVMSASGRISVKKRKSLNARPKTIRACRKCGEIHVRFSVWKKHELQCKAEPDPRPVIRTDLAGRITHWNEAARELYGWEAKEVLGRFAAEVTVPPDERPQAQAIYLQLLSDGWWEGPFRVCRKDGTTFVARVSDRLIRDAEGRAVACEGITTFPESSPRVS